MCNACNISVTDSQTPEASTAFAEHLVEILNSKQPLYRLRLFYRGDRVGHGRGPTAWPDQSLVRGTGCGCS